MAMSAAALLGLLWFLPNWWAWATAGISAVIIAVLTAGWGRGRPSHRAATFALLGAIAIIVWATGGPSSNLHELFVVPAVVGSLVLSTRWFAALIAMTLLAVTAPTGTDLFGPSGIGLAAHVARHSAVWIPLTSVMHLQARARRRDHEALVRASELKDSFLTAVSHELRTPLTVIDAAAHMLSRSGAELSDDLRQHLQQRLVVNTERLRGLVTDLLDVDRLARGVMLLDPSRADLSQLVIEVVQGLQTDTGRVRMSLEPAIVDLDAAKIGRAVENLVVNALKHTSAPGLVWVSTRSTPEGYGRILVEDEGPGIPQEMKQSIFAPFVQGPASVSDASPGTGIGLALAHRLVRTHGGHIWVEDRPTGGTRFVIELPPSVDAAVKAHAAPQGVGLADTHATRESESGAADRLAWLPDNRRPHDEDPPESTSLARMARAVDSGAAHLPRPDFRVELRDRLRIEAARLLPRPAPPDPDQTHP